LRNGRLKKVSDPFSAWNHLTFVLAAFVAIGGGEDDPPPIADQRDAPPSALSSEAALTRSFDFGVRQVCWTGTITTTTTRFFFD
jgi:hypothetical protein